MAHDALGPADIDRLADYIGGALDGPDEAEVARLVAEDPRWRETYDLLAPGMTAVAAELRTMGAAAEPMPETLAVRLDEALAAEPRRHLSVVPGSGDGVRSRPRPRRRLRWAVPVAAAAGVLAFAGFGIDYLVSQSGGAADQATSAAGDSSAERAAPMLGADDAGASPGLRNDQIRDSGTNYTIATLASVPAAAAHAPAPFDNQESAASGGQRVSGKGAGELDRLRARAALQACIDAIAQINGTGPITVETIDYARYDNRPALVVRFTSAGATWAYAAGPNCGTPGRGADLVQRVQVR